MASPTDISIDGEGLHFHALDDADEGLFCACYADPLVMRFIGKPYPLAEASRAFDRMLSRVHSNPMRSLFVVVRDMNLAPHDVGLCGVPQWHDQADRADVGIMLLPSVWGRGYSRRVLRAFTTRVFSKSNAREVWIKYSIANVPLERAAAGAGYEEVRCAADTSDPTTRARAAYRSTWCDQSTANQE